MNDDLNMMILPQGEPVHIGPGRDVLYRVKSGRVEVYCVSGEDARFHKIFLAELTEGGFFPPLPDGEPRLAAELFPLTDSEVERLDSRLMPDDLKSEAAGNWFKAVARQSVFSSAGGPAEEAVRAWSRGEAREGAGDEEPDRLLDANQRFLRSLAAREFERRDADAALKKDSRSRQKSKVLTGALQSLVNWEDDNRPGDSEGLLAGGGRPVDFAVKAVAGYFGMDPGRIVLPAEMTGKMDQVTHLRKLVEKAGMRIRMIALEPGWHKKDAGPIIGYLDKEGDGAVSPVAILPDSSRSYRLYGPDWPTGVPVTAAIADSLKNDAFACYGGLPATRLSVLRLLRLSWERVWRRDWHTVLWISLLAGILPLIIPLITGSIFSDIIPINDRLALGSVTQVMLVSGFVTAIVSLIRTVACLRLKSHFGIYLESTLWSRLLCMPARFFRTYQIGDLAMRMQNIGEISNVFGGVFVTAVFNGLFSFWSLFLMLYYSLRLTGVAAVVWAAYLIAAFLLQRKQIVFQRLAVNAANATHAWVVQMLDGLYAFKLQGNEEQGFYLWARRFREEWKWKFKQRRIDDVVKIIEAVQPVILTMAVFYFTVNAVRPEGGGAAMSFADFMSFQALFASFNATMLQFVPAVSKLYEIVPHIDNIRPLLDTEPEVMDDKIDAGPLSGRIEVKNVFFSYELDAPMVLKDISFAIEPGEFVAFVGSSGCGKSTLLRLLLGFEQPVQGVIQYDGQDLASLSATSVRSQMGVVLQNGRIMSGDICTNIIGATALTVDDAWAAARLVGLDQDIENMPMGMHTLISEGGGNISGGQRQRILIARSLAARPRIIIMDEATSALDNRTQRIVADSVGKLNATRITVAHRLSTIVDADRIIVMDQGRIAEEGSYGELMRKDGLFAALAKRQLE